MNIATILSIADYEQPRTVDELHKWWFAKHQEYGATKEGRIYCREGGKLSKKFYEGRPESLRCTGVICPLFF